MITSKTPITLPFEDYKWKWASVQCTEGLNDPLYLLGVLYRLHKLEDGRTTYSSKEFGREMTKLENEIKGKVSNDVSLSSRTGDRNLMRNSKQYWTSVGLITNAHNGVIQLTDFGRKIAQHEITQTEFAAITVRTFTLPNNMTMSTTEIQKWNANGISFCPLKLILKIIRGLYKLTSTSGYLTNEELYKVVVPISAIPSATIEDYINCILEYRDNPESFQHWPNCVDRSNDKRITREFLLFLEHYGFLSSKRLIGCTNHTEHYDYNFIMDDEIEALISDNIDILGKVDYWHQLQTQSSIISSFERKRIKSSARPNQAAFRKQVMEAYGRCIVTNVNMPEILEAAHIIPYAYNGEDTAANGFPLRSDIHILFDSGHLRISTDGEVVLSERARMNYGFTIPPRINIPDGINRDFLKWRWDNYSGI